MGDEYIIDTELGNFLCEVEGSKLVRFHPVEIKLSEPGGIPSIVKIVQAK